VGRYEFLSEIAKGPFGALYELHAEVGKTGLDALGRVVSLPGDLPPEAAQAIGAAVKNSLGIGHDLVLRVADVLSKRDWVGLIHDHCEGTVVRALQRRAQERQMAFPAGVALRIAIDVLDGLEQTQDACQVQGVPWCSGGASANSLYLCRDGITRALDGQLMATLMRNERTRDHVAVIGFPAPELVDAQKHPDERTDVFAVGALLWELLTGHELSLSSAVVRAQRPRPRVPNVSLSAPKGAQIPQSLAQAINAALELDLEKRPLTRREFKHAVTRGIEVATHQKVIEFIDALLMRTSTLDQPTLKPQPKLSDELRSAGILPGAYVQAEDPIKPAHSKVPRPPAGPSLGTPTRKPTSADDEVMEVEPDLVAEPAVKRALPTPTPAKSSPSTAAPPAKSSPSTAAPPAKSSPSTAAPASESTPSTPAPAAKSALPKPTPAGRSALPKPTPAARSWLPAAGPTGKPSEPTSVVSVKPAESTRAPAVKPAEPTPAPAAAPDPPMPAAVTKPNEPIPIPVPDLTALSALGPPAAGEPEAAIIGVAPTAATSPPVAPDSQLAPAPAPMAQASPEATSLDLQAPWKASAKRLFVTKRRALVIGGIAAAAIVVVINLAMQGGSSKAPPTSANSAAIAARSQPAAPTPAVAETAPKVAPPTEPVEASSAAQASTNPKTEAPTTHRAAAPGNPPASKKGAFKRDPRYVPRDL
jgi:hypothetical protein